MGRSQGIVQLFLTLIVFGVIIMATVIGNIFVIAAILLERNLRTVANSLIASLAVADLMVAALVMPLAAVNDVNDRWVLGREVCEMWTSFDVLCCTSSILHLVVISLDRYWAVTRVDYIHNRSPRRIGLMIGASWGLSAVISIPPLFGWRDKDTAAAAAVANRTEQCVISQDPAYTVFSTVGAFYLPLAFIVVVYLNVYRVASARIRRRNFPRSSRAVANARPPVEETPSAGLNLAPDETSAAAPPLQGFPADEISLAVPVGCSSRTSSIHDADLISAAAAAAAASRQYLSVTPRSCSASSSTASTPRGSWLSLTPYLRGASVKSTETRVREKRAQGRRERKAARTLVVITGSFVVCWLPFFLLATVRPFCGDGCPAPAVVVSAISWLGYFNSVLNPIIYTVFNPDFRTAFRKIIFGKYRRRRSPRTIPDIDPEKKESRA